MGTRDDEYDYLFKGEPWAAECLFGGPRHSRGTRATASPDRDGARLSASSLRPLRGSRHSSRFLRPGEGCRALSPLAVCLPRWLRSSRPGSFFPGHLGPLLSDARCRPHIPSDRPLPRLSTHSGAPTLSLFFVFFFGFHFFFSFPLPSLRVSPSWASARFARPRAPTPIPADLEVSTGGLPSPSPQSGSFVPFLFTQRLALRCDLAGGRESRGGQEGAVHHPRRACTCRSVRAQATSHLASFTPFPLPSLPGSSQTGMAPLLSGRGCGWVVAVIPARPEGPVPEQERLRAAQILASLSPWTACFLLQYWEDPAGREGPWLVPYLSQAVGEGSSGSVLLVK